MKKIKVLIVDDHAVVRMGLKYALSLFVDIELAGELADGEGAAELMRRSGADVVLLDIRMPGKDGIATLGDILAADPSAKVVMLTTSSMEEDVYASLNAGAKGYVLKDRNPENIVKAVRAVAEGGTFIPDDIKAIYKTRTTTRRWPQSSEYPRTASRCGSSTPTRSLTSATARAR